VRLVLKIEELWLFRKSRKAGDRLRRREEKASM